MLCVIVVPGDIIKVQEREHFVAVLLQATNEFLRCFAGDRAIGETIVETLDSTSVLFQEAFF